MRYAVTALLALVFFASGLTSGFFVGRSHVVHHTGDLASRREVLEAYSNEVGLSAEQRARFWTIIEDNHPRFVAARARIEPDLAVLRSDVRAQMRLALAADQLARFDAYCAKRDVERAARDR